MANSSMKSGDGKKRLKKWCGRVCQWRNRLQLLVHCIEQLCHGRRGIELLGLNMYVSKHHELKVTELE